MITLNCENQCVDTAGLLQELPPNPNVGLVIGTGLDPAPWYAFFFLEMDLLVGSMDHFQLTSTVDLATGHISPRFYLTMDQIRFIQKPSWGGSEKNPKWLGLCVNDMKSVNVSYSNFINEKKNHYL